MGSYKTDTRNIFEFCLCFVILDVNHNINIKNVVDVNIFAVVVVVLLLVVYLIRESKLLFLN